MSKKMSEETWSGVALSLAGRDCPAERGAVMGRVRNLDPRWRILALQVAFTKRRIRYLARNPRPIAFTASWGGFAVLHLDTRRPGNWRATWLDRDGEPWGHADCSDFASALKRAHEEGAHMFNELPSPLKASQ